MITAKMANALSEEMFCTGGFIGKLNKKIMIAIGEGKTHITFDSNLDDELKNVLVEFVTLGYKVSRVPKYSRQVNTPHNVRMDYTYMISW